MSRVAASEQETPCDFLEYLEWRLGQSRDSTARLLGEWLASYEPERRGGGSRHPGLARARNVTGKVDVQAGSRAEPRKRAG